MIRIPVFAVLPAFLVALAGPSHAQVAAPSEIRTLVAGLAVRCALLGGQPVRGAKPVAQPIDLTGDGRLDWVFSERAYACQPRAGGAPRVLGNGVAVLVDDGRGRLVKAWEGRPLDMAVVLGQVFVAEGGRECLANAQAVLACSRVLRWNSGTRIMTASADLPRMTQGQEAGRSSALNSGAPPAAVERVRQEHIADCRSYGGVSIEEGYETRADLNRDGIDDYIIDVNRVSCVNAASLFSGSAGSPLLIFISGPAGFRQEFDSYVQGWEVDRTTTPISLKLGQHGSSCGNKYGSEPCYSRVMWDGRKLVQRADRTIRLSNDEGDAPAPATARDGAAETGGPSQIASAFPIQDPATGKPRLPVKLGIYVAKGARCGTADRQVFIDVGHGADISDALGDIESLQATGRNTYLSRQAGAGNGDPTSQTVRYEIKDDEHFTVRHEDGTSENYSFCPLASLPLDQQQWPEAEHKQVAALPFKPGLYRAWIDDGSGKECSQECGYYRFGANSYSFATQWFGEVTRQSYRLTKIVQTGAVTYDLYVSQQGGDDYPMESLTIHSPSRIEGATEDTMNGPRMFRPIDPKSVPPNMMPR